MEFEAEGLEERRAAVRLPNRNCRMGLVGSTRIVAAGTISGVGTCRAPT